VVRKKKVQQVLVLARLFRLPQAQKLRHPERPVLLLRLAIALLQKERLASLDKPKFLLVSNSLLSKRLKPNKRSRSKLQVDKILSLNRLSQPNRHRQLQNKQAASNARYKGVLTMVDGDFSAAVGTWKDANGNTVTVSGNGQFTVQSADGKTDNYSIASYSYTLDDGKYNAQLSGQGNANLQITTGADGSVTSVVVTQP